MLTIINPGMEKVKCNTTIDYILKILAIAKQKYPNQYVSLHALMKLVKMIDYPMSFTQMLEIASYLYMLGRIRKIFSLADIKAQITTDGLMYIEDRGEAFEEEFKNIFKALIKEDEYDITGILDGNFDPKPPVINLLDKISGKIKENEGDKADWLKDMEIIKMELSKFNPNSKLFQLKLENLPPPAYIDSEIQELKDYLLIGEKVIF